MLRLRKFCVIYKQCCFSSSEAHTIETTEYDLRNTNETALALSKTISSPISKEVLKLTLIVLDTVHMPLGHEYEIYPEGFKASKRKSRDNCVYAGCVEKQGNLIINDILLPPEEKGIGKRHFMVKYNKNKHTYAIKDMGEGMGTFIRLDQPLKLKSSYIISFGDSHMIVNLDNTFITLRFIEGPKIDYKS
jgi:FHA domain